MQGIQEQHTACAIAASQAKLSYKDFKRERKTQMKQFASHNFTQVHIAHCDIERTNGAKGP